MPPNLKDYYPEKDSPDISLTSRADLAKLPDDKCRHLRFISETHVNAFDWFLETGLPGIPEAVDPIEFQLDKDDNSTRYKIEIETVQVDKPEIPSSSDSPYRKLYPSECRQRKIDYTAPVHVTFNMTNLATGDSATILKKELIRMPIMVLSSKCHLRGLTPRELVKKKEDHFEIGGYFICGGNEKVLRNFIPVHFDVDSFIFYLTDKIEKKI